LGRNRSLGISTAPLKSQVHQDTGLFTSAATNQTVVQRLVHGKLRSDFQSIGRDGVAVKVDAFRLEWWMIVLLIPVNIYEQPTSIELQSSAL